MKSCSHFGSQWLTSIWDAVCSISNEVKKIMYPYILAMFLPVYKECRRLCLPSLRKPFICPLFFTQHSLPFSFGTQSKTFTL